MTTRRPPANLQPESICPDPEAARRVMLPDMQWQHFHCELVTPLFGGGVKAREVDRTLPIRSTGLRGQWRFWWRLLARHRDGLQGAALRDEEFAVWGGLGTPPQASKVWVRVDGVQGLKLEDAMVYPEGKTFPKPQPWAPALYALFPAQKGKSADEQPVAKLALAGLRWQMHVGLRRGKDGLTDAQCDRVWEALRWWASFGGVGARTRRGLGAVRVSRVDGDQPQPLPPVTPEEARQAGCELVLMDQPAGNATDAWRVAIERLQRYRQGPGVGRNPGAQNRPGRSRWPEADAIRRAAHRHAELHPPEHKAGNVWPRAYFGLPIVFHFKDRDDPADHVLQPRGRQRMASPLILRPMRRGPEDRWFPGALLLPYDAATTMDMELMLVRGATRVRTIPADAVWPKDEQRRMELACRIRPMDGEKASPLDPLQAFLSFFKQPGAAPAGQSRQGGARR